MKEIKDKIIDFFKDKKNRKIVIVSGIAVVTAVGIVLGVTLSPAGSGSGGDGANSTVTSGSDANFNQDLTNPGADPNVNPEAQFGNVTASGQDPFGPSGGASSAGGGSAQGGQGAPGTGGSAPGGSGGSIGGGGESGGGESLPVTVNCTIAIDCSSISGNGALTAAGHPELEPYAANPTILGARNITVVDTNGDGRVGVDEALKQACDTAGIQYEFKGSSYVRGINYLYEFNAGPNSGWMYRVNGVVPNKGCNSYYLKGAEDILWYYVISY